MTDSELVELFKRGAAANLEYVNLLKMVGNLGTGAGVGLMRKATEAGGLCTDIMQEINAGLTERIAK